MRDRVDIVGGAYVERVGEDRDPSFVKLLSQIENQTRSLTSDMRRTGYGALDWVEGMQYAETDRRLTSLEARVASFSRTVQDHAPFA